MFEGFDDDAPIEPDDSLLRAVHVRATRRRRQRLAVTTAGAIMVVVASVSVAAALRSDDHGGSVVAISPTPSTNLPLSTVPGPLPPITSHLELPSTVVADSTVEGTLVVENNTAAKIDLTEACDGWVVSLEYLGAPPIGPPLPCSSVAFVLAPGVTRMPFSLSTAVGGLGRSHAFFVGGPKAFAQYAPERVPVEVVAAGSTTSQPSTQTTVVATTPTSVGSVMTTPITSVGGSVVSASLEVPTIVASHDAVGTLVINNPTGAPVTYPNSGCWWEGIILTTGASPGYHPTPPCTTALVVAPGTTRITLHVTRVVHNPDGSGGTAAAPYPVGHYTAWLDPSATFDPITPTPVDVDVVVA